MTDINNMLLPNAARPHLPPQAQAKTPPMAAANGQKTPTLSDFVGLLLTPQGTPPDAATLQNMPENLKALAEKIAALLNGTTPSGDSAALTVTDPATLPATLTSDLSATLAETLQNSAPAEISGDTDMNMLANLLNNLEPGAGGDASTAIEAALGLPELKGAAQRATPATPAVPATPATAGVSPATPAIPAIPATPAMPAAAGAVRAEAADAAEARPQQSQNNPLPAAPAAPAQQAAPAANAPKADTSLQTLLTAMAAQNGTNGGVSGDAGAGFGQSGFGQNGFAGSFSAADNAFGALALNGHTQPAFVQYMSAAGQSLPPQTSQMIAVQIQRSAAAKVDTFTLQLDPADLGRMDIELKFKHDGSLKAHLTVERPETLALLQKDAVYLERLLQQSGLNTDGQSLSFDLRQQGGGHEKRELQTGVRAQNGIAANIGTNDGNDTTLQGYIGPRGVNIMV